MERAFGFGIGEILTEYPALYDQGVAERAGVSDDLRRFVAFLRADVQPDTQRWALLEGIQLTDGVAVIPPDGRGDDGEAPKDVGAGQAEIERDDATEGGATEPGAVGIRA